jgi:hypothetical protein
MDERKELNIERVLHMSGILDKYDESIKLTYNYAHTHIEC